MQAVLLLLLLVTVATLVWVIMRWRRTQSALASAEAGVARLADALPGDGQEMTGPISRVADGAPGSQAVISQLARLHDGIDRMRAAHDSQLTEVEDSSAAAIDHIGRWLTQSAAAMQGSVQCGDVPDAQSWWVSLETTLDARQKHQLEVALQSITGLVGTLLHERRELREQAMARVARIRQLIAGVPELITASADHAVEEPHATGGWFSTNSAYQADGAFEDLAEELMQSIIGPIRRITVDAYHASERVAQSVVAAVSDRLIAKVGRLQAEVDEVQGMVSEGPALEGLLRVGHQVFQLQHQVASFTLLAGGWSGIRRADARVIEVIASARGRIAYPNKVRLPDDMLFQDRAIKGAAVEEVATVIAHLLENASSFTLPDQFVQVTVTCGHQCLSVTIDDAGAGMPHDALADARDTLNGEQAVRVSDLAVPAQIGFAVCRTLSAKCGFQIYLDEQGPLGGVRATLRLPPELLTVVASTHPRESAFALPAPRADATAGTRRPRGDESGHRALTSGAPSAVRGPVGHIGGRTTIESTAAATTTASGLPIRIRESSVSDASSGRTRISGDALAADLVPNEFSSRSLGAFQAGSQPPPFAYDEGPLA